MFKRKATVAEKQAVADQEEVEIAMINIQGGFTTMSEEHQLNRARMVLQATDFATYDRLMLGSIPSRRKDFQYIIGVYKKDVAEKILMREKTEEDAEGDTPKVMRVTEILNIAGKRAHAVEATFDTLEARRGADRDEMSTVSATDEHEYTLVILEHSVEHIKQLRFRHVDLTHWDWTPLSNGEIEIEAEIYDPRQITTMQYEESMNVLGMSALWSTASNMLPSAHSIQVPDSYQQAKIDPSPEAGNTAGRWNVTFKGAGLITKCMTMQDNGGNNVQKDVPLGAKVMMKLSWTGAEDPTMSDWPILPLWVQCPEQIVYDRGEESWMPAQPVEPGTIGAFQYPPKVGRFYLEQEEPDKMHWVNVRWKTPGLTKGKPVMLDARSYDLQEGEYYAMAGAEVATKYNYGREVAHLDRRRGRASRPGSHKTKRQKDGVSSSSVEKPLGYSGKEKETEQPPHTQTRRLQEAWKGAIEGKEARAMSQQSGATAGGAKAPPCWKVASKALHTGVDMSELLIQLSAEGELVKRGAEASGILPHTVIDAKCGSAACKKEPCMSALKQSRLPDFEARKIRQDDPELTQMAGVNQRPGGAAAAQTPISDSMAGGKRGSCTGTEGSASKRTGEGSPFRTGAQNDDSDLFAYDDDSDRTTWPAAANNNPFPFVPQQPTMQAQMAASPMQAQMAPSSMQTQMHVPPIQAPQAQMAAPPAMQAQQAQMGAPQMMPAPQAMYPNALPPSGYVQVLQGQPVAGMPGQTAQYASAFGVPQEIPMKEEELEDWKTNIPALNRVTPEFRMVAAAQSRRPWLDLSDTQDAQLIAMKDAYDNGKAGLGWNHPMWVRDVGYALQKAQVIGDMKQLDPLIAWCAQKGVVKSHDPTKCRLSFTKELPLRRLTAASSGGKGAPPSGKGAAGNYMPRGKSQARGKGGK